LYSGRRIPIFFRQAWLTRRIYMVSGDINCSCPNLSCIGIAYRSHVS
jgi:hypothetical protein